MSAPGRPNLVLCAAADSRIEPFRDQLAAHPAIAWISPHQAARLDGSAASSMSQGRSFDLEPSTGRDGESSEPSAERGARYVAWQPRRFIDFPVVQWNVARHLSEAKLLFCLRDPIDVAHLRYLASPDEMPDSFEQAIADCEAAMVEMGSWSSRSAWGKYFDNPSPLSLLLEGGVYAPPLGRCTRLLDRGQIHCAVYEEFLSDPRGTLEGIWEFLDLEAVEQTADLGAGAGGQNGDESIPAPLREQLAEYYAEHNAHLAELLDGLPAAWT